MLRELHISNLAVIADARVELAPGLNCFTGATGAGKSLVVGAIELLLGLRSAAEMLRAGVEEGRVSGIFEIRSADVAKKIEAATDLAVSDDGGEVLLARRIHASGRSSISLNGHPITLGMLKQVAEHLIDVHGQHDQQFLLKPSNQLEVLDDFAGVRELREQYHDVYRQLESARQRLHELTIGAALREQQLELYRFQAAEIDAAQPSPGEYEELSARATMLRNLGKLTKDVTATHSALYQTDGAVLERLKMMCAVLAELSMLDQQLKPIAASLRDGTIALEEVAFDLARYLDKLDLDPAEIAEVEDRLNVLNRILSKYGPTVQDALAERDRLHRQIEELEWASTDLDDVTGQIEPLAKRVAQLAAQLSRTRSDAAARLTPLVERELAELGMERAKFRVGLSRTDPAPSGADEVEFLARTNPGLAELPLRKIASGGELSRIMLALKGILAQTDRVNVLVFDEIDANVGGRLGSVIGEKLRRLATRQQVLCITHLPQIACYADRHLTVRKRVNGGTTQTSVSLVQGPERIEELAEMIGGQRITQTTRDQATELIESAQLVTASRTSPRKVGPRKVRS